MEIQEGKPVAHVGDEFEIVVRFFGLLPLRWRGVWRAVDHPVRLMDEALHSPFAYCRHQHEVEAVGPARTRMTDDVHYLFPGGWLGKWVGETLGRLQFHVMFADRHARTRRWMREHP